ncbi:unnamed protein product [Peniophora sp. CBMAI 1063]|nr:unnamed protein product [Peniophora sp. CBMAI 1063]
MALVAVGMIGVAAYQAVSKRREVKRSLQEQEALMAAGAVPVPFLEQASPITPSETDSESPTPSPSISRYLSSASKIIPSRSSSATTRQSIGSSSATPTSPRVSSAPEVATIHVDEPRSPSRRIGRTLRRHLKREEATREESFEIDPADEAPPPSYQEAMSSTSSVRRQLAIAGTSEEQTASHPRLT